MPRIVLVGAGSVEFTRNLLGDILASPALRDVADRAPRHRSRAARDRGADGPLDGGRARRRRRRSPPISTAARRSQGADFVVNTIQVGGARATRVDFDVAGPVRAPLHDRRHDRRRWRVPRPADDPGRPRHRPRHGGGLPERAGSSTTRTRWRSSSARSSEATSIRVVGLCHSVFWTVDRLAGYLGLPREEVDATSAGLNHLAFILRLEHRGRDLYPGPARVRRGRPRPPTTTSSGPSCSGGSASTRPSRPSTTPSTTPGTSASGAAGDAVERFHIPIGEYLDRVSHNLDEYAETKRMLDAGEPFEIERSGEYAATIAEAMTTGEPARIVANVLNGGSADPEPGRRRVRRGPGARRRARRPPGRDGAAAAPPRRLHPRRRRHAGPDGPGRARPGPRRRSATRS